ncbi:GntR family transcriptional regulator YhfZ [Mesobacillus subterraneus]|uniref:GntR family transcriptional regulator YhfZ n=1 Tax=Mesobacillus subterraneus TaxID=285983 RepID=UPI00273EF7D1|nr:GntR family transcriptional regulator YhfZ [Mesobacillus subterraneus]WLR55382.1 GntR family transcriptional regulator YhfZ [Mesobacillus subterraneus]
MSRIDESLYSKNGLAARYIARELIDIETGQRIPRISDFTEKLSLGRGTVQGALKLLEEIRAIRLESRGHLGTFLLKRDLNLLYEIAGIGPIIGVMPLPYSRKYEGLATGIIEVLERTNKRIDLAYMRGALPRVEALKSRRYDFAIMSLLAAEEAVTKFEGLEINKTFGPESYVTAHKIFFSNPHYSKIEDRMRVGIDYSSVDQAELTLLECEGKQVELVEVGYMQLFSMLTKGMIDAAVWNVDEERTLQTFKSSGFHSPEAKELAAKATTAALVVESARGRITEQLGVLDTSEVRCVQKQVVEGIKYPHY